MSLTIDQKPPIPTEPLLGLAADYFWQTDETGRIVAFESLSGQPLPFKKDAPPGFWWEFPGAEQGSRDSWASLNRAFTQHEPFRDIEIAVEGPSGATIWLVVSGTLVDRDEPDAAFRGIARDITPGKIRRAADLERTDRLRSASHAARVGIYDFRPARGTTIWSRPLIELLGMPPDTRELVFEEVLRIIHPHDRGTVRQMMHANLREPGSYEFEYRALRTDGRVRWLLDRGESFGPLDESSGRVARIAGTVIDVTERKEKEMKVAASEALFRTIFNQQFQFMALLDAEGVLLDVNRLPLEVAGLEKKDVLGKYLWDTEWFEPTELDEPYWRNRMKLARDMDKAHLADEPYATRDQGIRYAESSLTAIRDEDGHLAFFVLEASDVTEQKLRTEKERFLVREVSHRSKNLLNIVQAIAAQTLGQDMQDYRKNLGQRLRAMAVNLDLLIKNAWESVDLAELVRSHLAHFADLDGSEVSIEGPSLDVPPQSAQLFAMVVNELATNAAKYGALSSVGGRVAIRWRTTEDGDEPLFVFEWLEDGGPRVARPVREGFGTTVIKRMPTVQLKATVSVDYLEDGLRYELRCPLRLVTK